MTHAVDATTTHRPHLDELDRLRIITALSVVAVHVLANTTFLDHTALALELQNAFVTAFHFTREVFMFVTALALVYVYAGKPLAPLRFWKKRAVAVLIPYALWSLIYVLVNTHTTSFWLLSRTLLTDLLTGSASYQLYYILLTLEFYLIFPWFLRILPALARRPWLTLSVSFTLEVAILYADQHFVTALPLSVGAISFITQFFDRFVLVYQFYFVLGALVALYLTPIRAFIVRHGAWMLLAGGVALAALEARYVYEVNIKHATISSAIVVLQPIMAFYSLGCIAFLYWLTHTQARRVAQRGDSRTQRVWRELSDTAFGVYLIHPLVLGALLAVVAPHLAGWPVAGAVGLLWLLTAGGSVACTLLLLCLPIISRAVGRARPAPAWLSDAWARMTRSLGGVRARLAHEASDEGDTLPAFERTLARPAACETASGDTSTATGQ